MPRAISTAPRRQEAPTEGERFSNCRRNQGEAGERRASLTSAPQVATPTVLTPPWSSISRVISTPQRKEDFPPADARKAKYSSFHPRQAGALAKLFCIGSAPAEVTEEFHTAA